MDEILENRGGSNQGYGGSVNQGSNVSNMDYGELPCLEDGTATDKSDSVGTSPIMGIPDRMEYRVYESPRKTQTRRTKKAMTMLHCDECKATFRLPQDLLKHKKLHKGEQLFECHICGRTYTRRDNMKLHMRIHIKERPFSCAQCGETFRYRPNLTRHKHIKHGLPKAYSLTPSKTKSSGIDRSVLTGLLPDYNFYAQHNALTLQNTGMPSVAGPTQPVAQRTQPTSIPIDPRNAGYHRQNNITGVMTHQQTNYSPSMPVIGQVYSLNQSQLSTTSPVTTVATTHTSKANVEMKADDRNKQMKSQKQQMKSQKQLKSFSESVSSLNTDSDMQVNVQDQEGSGSGGEGINDGFTIHWRVLQSEGVLQNSQQSPDSLNRAGTMKTGGVFARDFHEGQSDEAGLQPTLSTDSEESGQRSLQGQDQDNALIIHEDREEGVAMEMTENEKDEDKLEETERNVTSPQRLTIPRIGLKIGNRNLASTFNRRKQMLPLRLSTGRSQLKTVGMKKDNEQKVVKPSEESIDETESSCESCQRLKEFRCQYCEISFPDLSTFMIHRGCHGRESAFQCNACGQCCKDRVEFNAHIITGHFM
ncbi:uncharacterized protein [Ptychodera flava]|uniref:uncharacterized protein n=1 Tax=Ptychodera flava TaxID=63121 RepID=UPI00396A0731